MRPNKINAKPITISLPGAILEMIEIIQMQTGVKRSELIRGIICRYFSDAKTVDELRDLANFYRAPAISVESMSEVELSDEQMMRML